MSNKVSDYITPEEAVALTGYSAHWLRRLFVQGRIGGFEISKRGTMYLRADVIKWHKTVRRGNPAWLPGVPQKQVTPAVE